MIIGYLLVKVQVIHVIPNKDIKIHLTENQHSDLTEFVYFLKVLSRKLEDFDPDYPWMFLAPSLIRERANLLKKITFTRSFTRLFMRSITRLLQDWWPHFFQQCNFSILATIYPPKFLADFPYPSESPVLTSPKINWTIKSSFEQNTINLYKLAFPT